MTVWGSGGKPRISSIRELNSPAPSCTRKKIADGADRDRNQWAERSAVDLAEDDVDGPDDGDGIRQHVSPGHGVHRLEVSEARAPDLAAVRLIGSVRYHEHPE